MKKYLSILSLLVFFQVVSAQNSDRIDSLENMLHENHCDTIELKILHELAEEYLIPDTSKSIYYLKKLHDISKSRDYNEGLGIYYRSIGRIRNYYGHYKSAIANFELAKRQYSLSGNSIGYAHATCDQGNAFLFQSEYEIAAVKYKEALEIFTRKNDLTGMTRCLNNIGIVYKNFGEYARALKSYNDIIPIYEQLNDLASVADVYINIGIVYVLVGQYDLALKNFNQSLEVAEQDDNKLQQTKALMNSGVTHNKMGNYHTALRYYEKALKISKEINNKQEKSKCLTNIGTNYISMNKFDLAEEFILKGLEIKEQLGNLQSISNSYDFLADIAFHREEYVKAIELQDKALSIKRNIGDSEGMARCFNNLGRTFLALDEYEDASNFADSSLAYSFSSGMLEHITESYFIKKEAAKDLGLYKEAVELGDLHKLYSDSLVNESKVKAVNEIEFRYQNKELEDENERLKLQAGLNREMIKRNKVIITSVMIFTLLFVTLLILLVFYQRRQRIYALAVQKKNQIITKQNLQLDNFNRTKDKILSVITHDIRGTIGNQLTALEILGKEDFKNEDEKRIVLSRLSNSATLTLELLENLTHWTKLQEGHINFNPEEAYLNDSVNEVCQRFSDSLVHKQITLTKNEWSELPCFYDQFMMDGIIKNLVSNAIKFTRRGGEIEITIVADNGDYIVSIKDNGIGMSPGELAEIKRGRISKMRRGTENEKGSGLGLSLVKNFLDFHHSELIFNSEKNIGTTVSFRVNKKRPV